MEMKVCEPIDFEKGKWDPNRDANSLIQEECDLVWDVPLSTSWPNSNGLFSVKCGY